MRRIFNLIRRLLLRLLLLLTLAVLLQYSTVPLGLGWNAVSAITSPYQFDYLTWELKALAVKVAETLYGLHPFMSEADSIQYVRDYMAQLQQAQIVEAQIGAIYADPTVTDPASRTELLRTERDQLRADLARKQPLAEAILEGQVAAVLVQEGFGVLGQIL